MMYSPESLGISSTTLNSMLEELKKINSLNGFVMQRHGKICMEGYWRPYQAEVPHLLFSLSKSFTSTAIALAQAEGRLNINDKLLDYFPEYDKYVTDEKMRKVTLRHLLTMSSGHDICARPYMLADADKDWVRGFLASPLPLEPGERFAYNSAATYMLSAVISKVTGLCTREYLIPRLFSPLGIEPGPWDSCPRGISCGGWGLFLTTRDIATFAQLLLQKGQWNGRQLLPWDYFEQATTMQIDNNFNGTPDWSSGYGYQFWVCQHGYRGDGASGQFALVIPEWDMAIGITAGLADMQGVLDILWRHLENGLSDKPLQEKPQEFRSLQDNLANLEVPLEPDLGIKGNETYCRWTPGENSAGISEITLAFDGSACVLQFRSRHGIETVRAGFGYRIDRQLLWLNDSVQRQISANAVWTGKDTLDIYIISTEASFRDVFHIDMKNPARPIDEEARYNTFRTPFLPWVRG